jgi:hypothetical protein
VKADDKRDARAFAVLVETCDSYFPLLFAAQKNNNKKNRCYDNAAPCFARSIKSGEYTPTRIVKAVVKLDKRHAEQTLNVVQRKAEQEKSACSAESVKKLEDHIKGKPPETYWHENQERKKERANNRSDAQKQHYEPLGGYSQDKPAKPQKKKCQFG